mmetsp:Transcript_29151/g.78218  ORF Transcript_29151/g.78218 Transcript_29151/m.78218 type:complete len:230 (+) Transcript_29151:57-746(+)
MPLVARAIPIELNLVDDALYREARTTQILQDINEASMLGTFHQLGLLSQHAADIFKGILEEANTSHNRIQRMSTRAHGVLDRLEATETYINTHQSSYNFGEVQKPRHEMEKTSTQMFEQSSRKPALQAQYEGIKYDTHASVAPTGLEAEAAEPKQVARTPDFASIDACLPADMVAEMGGTTRRKWSYPEYFLERWVEEEYKREEERREAKKVGWGVRVHLAHARSFVDP